jgi:hypothetical protein
VLTVGPLLFFGLFIILFVNILLCCDQLLYLLEIKKINKPVYHRMFYKILTRRDASSSSHFWLVCMSRCDPFAVLHCELSVRILELLDPDFRRRLLFLVAPLLVSKLWTRVASQPELWSQVDLECAPDQQGAERLLEHAQGSLTALCLPLDLMQCDVFGLLEGGETSPLRRAISLGGLRSVKVTRYPLTMDHRPPPSLDIFWKAVAGVLLHRAHDVGIDSAAFPQSANPGNHRGARLLCDPQGILESPLRARGCPKDSSSLGALGEIIDLR